MPFAFLLDRNRGTPASRRMDAALAPLGLNGRTVERLHDGPDLSIAWIDRPESRRGPSDRFIDNDLVLLLDGYVVQGPSTAAALADAYRRGGVEALQAIDGSFVLAVIEPKASRGLLLTDRMASRATFAAWHDDGILVAPELKCFDAFRAMRGELCPAALLSVALNSYLFDEMTYWTGVRALGPTRRLEFGPAGVRLERYWAPPFGSRPDAVADVAEFAAELVAAVERHRARFRNPILALSGGVDSRVIQAAAIASGRPLPTITWTYAADDPPNSDFAVAESLAERCGAEHRTRRLRWETLLDDALPLVDACDGLVGHLGGFTDRRALADEVSRDHDAILFGDECYRGEARANSPREAIEAIGISTLDQAALRRQIAPLFNPDVVETCFEDYRRRLTDMVTSAGQHASPHDLHDRLYWQVRLPRLLTGPKSLWRRYLEPVDPLLDGRLIESAAALPPEQRAEKTFLRAVLHHLRPDWDDIPFATTSSRIKWRDIFRRRGPFQNYVVETLLDPDPTFDAWFNRDAIERALRLGGVRTTATNGSSGGLLLAVRQRVAGLMGAMMLRPPTILSLLTIKLWLRRSAAATQADAIGAPGR